MKVTFGEPEGKKFFGTHRRKRENNKSDLKEIG
jgi:hypothetical protein